MESERLRERLEAENVYLHVELDEANGFREFVGLSPVLRVALEKVRRVAEKRTCLALGEPRAGIELFARTRQGAVRSATGRSRPLVPTGAPSPLACFLAA